jgi:hypothetical protein
MGDLDTPTGVHIATYELLVIRELEGLDAAVDAARDMATAALIIFASARGYAGRSARANRASAPGPARRFALSCCRKAKLTTSPWGCLFTRINERLWVHAMGSLTSARNEDTARRNARAHGRQCG